MRLTGGGGAFLASLGRRRPKPAVREEGRLTPRRATRRREQLRLTPLRLAGIVLLPFFAPLLTGGTADAISAARGPHRTVAFERDDPSFAGGMRPILLHGELPDGDALPWLLIATRSGKVPTDYDALVGQLASHGIAAIVVERLPDESWWQYADALASASLGLATEASTAHAPLFGRLERHRLGLLADGDGAAAAVRAAARIKDLAALMLLDPGETGPATAWLAEVPVPLLSVSSAEAPREPARAWFEAGARDGSARWLVQFEGENAFEPSAAPTATIAREVGTLVTTFAALQLSAVGDGAPPRSFRQLAKAGRIARHVESN